MTRMFIDLKCPTLNHNSVVGITSEKEVDTFKEFQCVTITEEDPEKYKIIAEWLFKVSGRTNV